MEMDKRLLARLAEQQVAVAPTVNDRDANDTGCTVRTDQRDSQDARWASRRVWQRRPALGERLSVERDVVLALAKDLRRQRDHLAGSANVIAVRQLVHGRSSRLRTPRSPGRLVLASAERQRVLHGSPRWVRPRVWCLNSLATT